MKLKGGGLALGVVLEESAKSLTLGQANGADLVITQAQVERRDAMSVSLMPAGLLNALSPVERRDLMTFLLNSE